ncbi:hypothetical protein ACJ2A9_15190 [Anaerobacillus sp. MEB173]|uniref:hypothetical protein n=1 Tax=Anaerobacillus sp. MEB173 TaxID=3383345 RepID=UPI003F8EDC4E
MRWLYFIIACIVTVITVPLVLLLSIAFTMLLAVVYFFSMALGFVGLLLHEGWTKIRYP